MALDDIVNVQITPDSVGVQEAGFGTPMIFSPNATFPERSRTYGSLSAFADDWDSTTPEYKMAERIFAQDVQVQEVKVGRVDGAAPTMRWKIAVAQVEDSTDYEVRIGDDTVTVTSDTDATNDEIVQLLVDEITTLDPDGLTASAQGSVGSKYLRIVADDAGAWFDVALNTSMLRQNLLTIEQDHDSPTDLADEIAAVAAEDDTWYGMLWAYPSIGCVNDIADYAESHEKLYCTQSQDSAIVQTTEGADTTSVAAVQKSAANVRTFGIYHPDPSAFADAAWLGRCLPLAPGSETWKFKTLRGVTAPYLSDSMYTNAKAKSWNIYHEVAGVNITEEGVVSGGEFVDVVRFRDWLKARIAESVFAKLAGAQKVPFTDSGIAVIQAAILARLKEGVDVGGLDPTDPKPTCTVPRATDVPTADRAARKLTGVKFTARLAGAIHAVNPINGVLTV